MCSFFFCLKKVFIFHTTSIFRKRLTVFNFFFLITCYRFSGLFFFFSRSNVFLLLNRDRN